MRYPEMKPHGQNVHTFHDEMRTRVTKRLCGRRERLQMNSARGFFPSPMIPRDTDFLVYNVCNHQASRTCMRYQTTPRNQKKRTTVTTCQLPPCFNSTFFFFSFFEGHTVRRYWIEVSRLPLSFFRFCGLDWRLPRTRDCDCDSFEGD